MVTSKNKATAVAKPVVSKNDTGSSSAQVANLTQRIESITGHVKENKHDYMARRGLLQLVGQRRRLLQYIARKDPKQYLSVVKSLGLRH